MKQQRSGFSVMRRLIVLVRPLAPFMALAVLLGVAGFVCAIFMTIPFRCAPRHQRGMKHRCL